ncbi:MAG: hypothetical protein CML13_14895 [Puniceicoccaceae bacterium]|nr:hypothetical protein [Puniceicoccaceae bacterium]
MSLHAKINRSYYAVLFTLLVTILAAAAQEAPATIRLQLSTLAWEKPIKGLYFQNAGKAEELKAYSGGFSMPFPTKEIRSYVFIRTSKHSHSHSKNVRHRSESHNCFHP